jgi:hypothetical protein
MVRLTPGIATLLAAACSSGGVPAVDMTWEAVDSLNARLPAAVRVYAGRNDWIPLRAWYVHVEPGASGVETRVLVSDDPADRRETVSSFAQEPGACVAMNGGYFAMDLTPTLHAGLLVTHDSLAAPATRNVVRDSIAYPVARAAIGFTSNGEIEIMWATSEADTVFAWARPYANGPGRPADAGRRRGRPWEVRDALGAGPMLLMDGQLRVTADEEVFFGTSIPAVHPRTAAGRTADGALVLLVVDGRQPESRGVSLEELAAIMRDLGAVDALNLDGGGSSSLVVLGTLLNRPTGGDVAREVMSAFVTFCESDGGTAQ